ncbi:NAD(P)H-binding protein [Pseudonocardia sp. CA-107938]|uniref:NmrA family NAD(P)-binding protein n=1 Tax=Pseudonocardia sp. CA-107938 TaxID=3240021 RepID=UPI003D92287E
MTNHHTIAVTAPTGHVGSRVAQLLVQAGTRPVLLVRDPDRLDPGLRAAAEVRTVDLADTESVRSSTKGVDAAFWLDGVGESAPDPIAASTAFGAAAAAAVEANEIGRNVFLSSGGAELRHGAGNIDGLAAIEMALDATGADVTHLRCGYFFTNLLFDLDGLRDGRISGQRRPDERIPWVDPRDIGEVAAARLLSSSWSGRHVQGVQGPQDLSFAEVAAILSEALGRPVRYVEVSDDDVREQMRAAGRPEAVIEGIVGMTAGTRDREPAVPREYVTTTPTPLSAWAFTTLRPLLAA